MKQAEVSSVTEKRNGPSGGKSGLGEKLGLPGIDIGNLYIHPALQIYPFSEPFIRRAKHYSIRRLSGRYINETLFAEHGSLKKNVTRAL